MSEKELNLTKKVIGCLFWSFVVVGLGFICVREVIKEGENRVDKWEAAGVVIYRDGWMENTNDFPVRIKQVWRFHGETAMKFRVLQPKQRVGQSIHHQYGFYILTMDGVEIGFIHSDD